MRAEVLIRDGQRRVKLNRNGIAALSRFVLEREGFREPFQLSLYFVNDSKIRELNRRYLKRDRPTDVLAFSMMEGTDAEEGILGDVVISTQQAVLNAKRVGTSGEWEISRYLVHGILHLLGYDDSGSKEARMREREEELQRKARRRGWKSLAY